MKKALLLVAVVSACGPELQQPWDEVGTSSGALTQVTGFGSNTASTCACRRASPSTCCEAPTTIARRAAAKMATVRISPTLRGPWDQRRLTASLSQ